MIHRALGSWEVGISSKILGGYLRYFKRLGGTLDIMKPWGVVQIFRNYLGGIPDILKLSGGISVIKINLGGIADICC